MSAVLDWLNGPLGTVGSQAIVAPAVAGLVVYIVCELAAARSARWVWPVAAVAAVAFAALSLAEGRFADAGIRLVLAVLCAYGWRVRRAGRVMHARSATGREVAYGVVLFAIATVVAAYALTDQSGDATSWGTAVIVAALFVQLAALARGLAVGWWTVLGGAIVGCALAVGTASWGTAVASVVIGAVAVYGWTRWRREAVASEPIRLPVLDDAIDEDLVA